MGRNPAAAFWSLPVQTLRKELFVSKALNNDSARVPDDLRLMQSFALIMRFVFVGMLAVSDAMAPRALDAQPRSGNLSGTVVDRATGSGLSGADIQLVEDGRRIVTDSA